MTDTRYKKGDRVNAGKYGGGLVVDVASVELASDNDNTFYVVEMDDGRRRHLKARDLELA